jgi:hypothetical protein
LPTRTVVSGLSALEVAGGGVVTGGAGALRVLRPGIEKRISLVDDVLAEAVIVGRRVRPAVVPAAVVVAVAFDAHDWERPAIENHVLARRVEGGVGLRRLVGALE